MPSTKIYVKKGVMSSSEYSIIYKINLQMYRYDILIKNRIG